MIRIGFMSGVSLQSGASIGLLYLVCMQSNHQNCRFVVLISGQGSNLSAIVQKCRSQGVQADFVQVISNRSDAPGLRWAEQQGIKTRVLSHLEFNSRESFDQALGDLIESCNPDYVILAGFMRILTAGFVQRFENRLINIHPSLLPAFTGLRTHERALASAVGWHGCTVHFVTAELDHGPIIAQAALEVYEHDTPESLAQRVLELEHQLYPEVVRWLAQGLVELDKTGRVKVHGVPQRHLKGYSL